MLGLILMVKLFTGGIGGLVEVLNDRSLKFIRRGIILFIRHAVTGAG